MSTLYRRCYLVPGFRRTPQVFSRGLTDALSLACQMEFVQNSRWDWGFHPEHEISFIAHEFGSRGEHGEYFPGTSRSKSIR